MSTFDIETKISDHNPGYPCIGRRIGMGFIFYQSDLRIASDVYRVVTSPVIVATITDDRDIPAQSIPYPQWMRLIEM